jgi:hypothetical protein
MTCREDSSEDIGATKCGNWRAIEYRQEEKARRPEMSQCGEEALLTAPLMSLEEQAQHFCNISIPLKRA